MPAESFRKEHADRVQCSTLQHHQPGGVGHYQFQMFAPLLGLFQVFALLIFHRLHIITFVYEYSILLATPEVRDRG